MLIFDLKSMKKGIFISKVFGFDHVGYFQCKQRELIWGDLSFNLFPDIIWFPALIFI